MKRERERVNAFIESIAEQQKFLASQRAALSKLAVTLVPTLITWSRVCTEKKEMLRFAVRDWKTHLQMDKITEGRAILQSRLEEMLADRMLAEAEEDPVVDNEPAELHSSEEWKSSIGSGSVVSMAVFTHERDRWMQEREDLKEELKKAKAQYSEAKTKLQDQTEVAVMLQELCEQAGLL